MDRDECLADAFGIWKSALRSGNPLTPEEACRNCPGCIDEFRRMLPNFLAVDAVLEAPDGDGVPAEALLTRLDAAGYQPLAFHRQGGLGVVLLGEDTELRRTVAIKCLKPSAAAQAGAGERFVQEAEITARLDHPGVVPVYRMGRDAADRPYYAMRFVRGATLTESIERHHAAGPRPDLREKNVEFQRLLRSFIQVCETIAYAHAAGVIHRDLKPENIMLGSYGETLVLDWGLAKRIERRDTTDPADSQPAEPDPIAMSESETKGGGSSRTQAGKAKGSPAFMSPEQARGDWAVVHTASDVYSLGATLYAILTGQAPYSAPEVPALERASAIIDKVARGQFVAPRTVLPSVPGALDAICRKAMAPLPAHRYATPRDLAADVERWLADEPVTAWREPAAARLRRWLRRHRPLVAATIAAVCVAFAGILAIAGVQRLAFTNQRDLNSALNGKNAELNDKNFKLDKANIDLTNAIARERESMRGFRVVSYFEHLRFADRNWLDNNLEESKRMLRGCVPRGDDVDLRGWEWRYLARRNERGAGMSFTAHDAGLTALAVSRRGLLVTGGRDGSIRCWRPEKEGGALQPRSLAPPHGGRVRSLAFSADGSHLVSVGDGPAGGVRVWDLRDIRTSRELPFREINAAAIQPDTKCVALAGEDGTIRVWNFETRREVFSTSIHQDGGAGRAACVAFSPDGKLLAAGGWYGIVAVWDVATGELLVREQKQHFTTDQLAFTPDSRSIASIGWDRAVRLWDARSGKDQRLFVLPMEHPKGLSISADGKFVATAGADRIIRIWNLQTGEELRAIRGHAAPVEALGFFGDAPHLYGGELSGGVKLWSVNEDQQATILKGHRGHVFETALSPDGKQALSAGADMKDATVKLWDIARGDVLRTFTGQEMPIVRVGFSPDGRRVAAISKSYEQIPDRRGKLMIWNATTGELEASLSDNGGGSFAFSPDGRLIAWGDSKRRVVVWDLVAKQQVQLLESHVNDVSILAFNADGAELYAVSQQDEEVEVRVWRPSDGQLLRSYRRRSPGRFPAALSADRKRVALIGGRAGKEAVHVWDLAADRIELTLTGHPGPLKTAAFSPDGKCLAVASDEGTTRLWDLATGIEALTLRHRGLPSRLVFGHDGHLLALACGPMVHPGEVRIWDARPME